MAYLVLDPCLAVFLSPGPYWPQPHNWLMTANVKSAIWSSLSLAGAFLVRAFWEDGRSVIFAFTALPIILAIPAWTCQATGSISKKATVVLLGSLFQGLSTCALSLYLSWLLMISIMVTGATPEFMNWGNVVWSACTLYFFVPIAYAVVGGVGTTIVYQWEKQSRLRLNHTS